MKLVDAHIHVDHMDEPRLFASQAHSLGIGLFSNTVTPQGALNAQAALGDFENVRVGLGLHPWWIDEAWQQQLSLLLELLLQFPYVGEVGLDFSPKRQITSQAQAEALHAIFKECAQQGGKVLSIHCVQAYEQLFDLMEQTGVCESCHCIIHWFSGTHQQLLQAREMGCWFSVGERLLSSKRGRAYVGDIPSERLLLETDAPPLGGSIQGAYQRLSQVFDEALAEKTVDNGCKLFGFLR